jgi:hypothetical protein
MAQGVTTILGGPNPPKHVVVLAGSGHVGQFAIPARAARRGVSDGLSLAPVDEQPEEPPQEADAVDIQYVLKAPHKTS